MFFCGTSFLKLSEDSNSGIAAKFKPNQLNPLKKKNEPEWEKVGLKALSLYFFKEPMISFDDVMQKAQVDNFAAVPLDLAVAYAGADAYQTYRLYVLLYERLQKENLLHLYETVEHPTMLILKKRSAGRR